MERYELEGSREYKAAMDLKEVAFHKTHVSLLAEKSTKCMEQIKTYNEGMAGYIWQILKADLPIIMSWGIDPGSVKVIEGGLEFHVQGFKHTGRVQIILNEGTDLFEIHLIPDSKGEEKIIEDVYVDMLVSVVDEYVEKTEDYEKRISEEYCMIRYPLV